MLFRISNNAHVYPMSMSMIDIVQQILRRPAHLRRFDCVRPIRCIFNCSILTIDCHLRSQLHNGDLGFSAGCTSSVSVSSPLKLPRLSLLGWCTTNKTISRNISVASKTYR